MKELKRGYTTGTCAAAASKAAVLAALGDDRDAVSVTLPSGRILDIPVEIRGESGRRSFCAVRKYSGDDPDITDGILIYSYAELIPEGENRVTVRGGEGVGRVTKPGLACDPGEAAINPVPMKMIREESAKGAEEHGFRGTILIEIAIPEGRRLAEKTFNPRLGIEGGLSILGTSGIVEPMSEDAIRGTIKAELSVEAAAGAAYILTTPGNYGETFIKETMELDDVYCVKCSNFVGDTIRMAKELCFRGLLFTAHIGKLSKVAAGAMNTHSKYGDMRMEALAEAAEKAGAGEETLKAVRESVMTDGALYILENAGFMKKTMDILTERAAENMREQAGDMEIAVVMFSNKYGLLAETENACAMGQKLRRKVR